MANFYARIAQAASAWGARPAVEMLADGGLETTSYDDLVNLAGGFANRLTATGVGRGDRVAILAANDARWVACYLGILRLGAIAVPLDTAYTAEQVTTVLEDSGAKAIVVSRRLGDRVSPTSTIRDPTSLVGDAVRVIDLADSDTAGVEAGLPVAEVSADDAAAILYTSGTTADPKGVVLTHANLEAERAAALAVIHVTETDVVLGVLPLFHALAQMANLLLPLTTGARVVFLETVNSTSLLGALESRGITIFACVPQFFYLIHGRVIAEVARRGPVARHAFRALLALNGFVRDRVGLNLGRLLFAKVHHALGPEMRLLITGGSRFDPAIARDFYGLGVVLVNGYGLTETSGAATVVRPGDGFSTSVGKPLPGVEVAIAPATATATRETGSPRESQETRSPGHHGQILIRGDVVMREYYNRPEATRDAIRDGWLHTGDVGFIDADGRVHITGRLKEIIVLSSGKNLYPEEIEGHYRKSAFIRELCVLGLSRPDEPASERLHAVIVPDEDALRARGIVNVRELVRFEVETLSVQLPAHKRILSYDIQLSPLPRTTTGKLKRGHIAALTIDTPTTSHADPPLTADDEAWRATGPRLAWLELIANRLSRASVSPAANLELDLGLDSMERVELLTFVEQRLARRVPPARRATIFTVRHLVEALEEADLAVSAAPDALGGTAQSAAAEREWHAILAEPAPAALIDPLGRHTRLRAWTVGLGLRALLLPMRAGLRIDVSGLDRLPTQGPYLICPNHQSHLDGFLLSALIPIDVLRQVFLVGASEYFDTSLSARVARFINLVPVDPDANLVTAMRVAASGLRLGRILILFPEGERSIDGQIKTFRKGAAILSHELDIPVVPVAIDGLFDVWPRGRGVKWRALAPWRRARVTITFGAPLRGFTGDPAVSAEILRKAVRALTSRSAVSREP